MHCTRSELPMIIENQSLTHTLASCLVLSFANIFSFVFVEALGNEHNMSNNNTTTTIV